MDTYIGLNGRYSKFTAYDTRHKTIAEATARFRDREPISLRASEDQKGFTSYDVVIANGIAEGVKYVYPKGEPVQFCVVDDPEILKQLRIE
jgi:hypothetical protein